MVEHTDKSLFRPQWGQKLTDDEKTMFGSMGVHCRLASPFEILNPQRVSLGDYVSINPGCKIAVYEDITKLLDFMAQCDPDLVKAFDPADFKFQNPRLEIADRVSIGRFAFITVTNRVSIGRSTILSERVYVSDTDHRYDDPSAPIMYQGLSSGGEVSIGEHSWVGIGACIINCKVGRHCVVGANAVVKRDVPDYSVVAGNPARVVKKYDIQAGKWRKCAQED
jgi:acetyltransferase-like isoleucine patch superfamily enzyme